MAVFGGSKNRGGDSGNGGLSPSSQGTGNKRGMFSVIGPDVTIAGNINATADLHIDGRIDGDVHCASLVQGPDSRINGSVKADVARLAGSIEGSVAARQITIERAARIAGDVEYETIAIENGASIDGRLKHIGADSGNHHFEHSPKPGQAPDISLVSSSGEAA